MLIDPPSGWRYGFPKEYIATRDGDLGQFILDAGYPPDDLDFALRHLRCISSEPAFSEAELSFLEDLTKE